MLILPNWGRRSHLIRDLHSVIKVDQHPEISTQYRGAHGNLRLGRFALLGSWSNLAV
ncbi:MAG: hypothetical protein ICV63_05635 [Coleofasciculus sp. Co-bin14]|nr:hypothetical protein [Coleofasciculus sp. Co-bin14]